MGDVGRGNFEDSVEQLACARRLDDLVPGLGAARTTALDAFRADGAVILADVPVDRDDVLIGLAAWFGTVTRIGNGPPPGALIRDLTWSPADGERPALAPHTDSAYSRVPHDAIALACAETSEGESGQSILAASRDLCDALDRGALEVLSTVPILFAKYRSGRLEEHFAAPVLDTIGGMVTCRFNQEHIADGEKLSGPVPRVVADALGLMTQLLGMVPVAIRLMLHAGDLLVIDNRRVLHGRTSLAGCGRRRLRRLKIMGVA